MQCVVLVKFLPGGSIAPEEFFARINAEWYSLEGQHESHPGKADPRLSAPAPSARSGICIADYDSIEQLAIDLSIMPGAGISNVEVLSIPETKRELSVPNTRRS